jgi:hypothetical protein
VQGGKAPPDQEYRAELLQLPYAFNPNRPVITAISSNTVSYGGKLKITLDTFGKGFVNRVSVIPPGANTHSLNMMQRVVFLKITARNKDNERPRWVEAEMPKKIDRVLNPGPYMLWVVDGDLPAKEARWITLKS